MVPPLPASHLLAGRHVAVRGQAVLLRRYASIGRPLSAGRGYTSQAPNHPPKTPENPPRGASQTTPFQRTQQGPAKDGEEETPVENNFFTNMFPFLAGRSGAFDTAMSAIVGLGMLFAGGVAYVAWYKKNVLDKIEIAFAPGYDPALELANHGKKTQVGLPDELDADADGPWTQHLRRREQDIIDSIVHGAETGHYYVLLGPKGVGKGTMLFDAMRATQADGVAICEAHPDLEVFRLRLGKALNFEFNEDSQTGVFQRRDPREGGPALDIERALNKLEKVALRLARKRGRPLVLILNNVHFLKNDDEGRNMLLQFQQRAESWAASGILTVVFSSDDFWPFFHLRKFGTRMHVLSVYDLDDRAALLAATRMRKDAGRPVCPEDEFAEAIGAVGGRLSYVARVAKARDAPEHARHMLAVEKAWLLSQIGLIQDCDDDVMDEQKWSSCSWLLLREFVNQRQAQEKAREERIAAGEKRPEDDDGFPMPSIPYWKCRQIMTRADFLEELDRLNIINIDINHDVRPDSMLILRAAQEVCDEEGFDDVLDSVRNRIDDIESLHRTRELTFKDVEAGDRVRLVVDKGGNRLVEG